MCDDSKLVTLSLAMAVNEQSLLLFQRANSQSYVYYATCNNETMSGLAMLCQSAHTGSVQGRTFAGVWSFWTFTNEPIKLTSFSLLLYF